MHGHYQAGISDLLSNSIPSSSKVFKFTNPCSCKLTSKHRKYCFCNTVLPLPFCQQHSCTGHTQVHQPHCSYPLEQARFPGTDTGPAEPLQGHSLSTSSWWKPSRRLQPTVPALCHPGMAEIAKTGETVFQVLCAISQQRE